MVARLFGRNCDIVGDLRISSVVTKLKGWNDLRPRLEEVPPANYPAMPLRSHSERRHGGFFAEVVGCDYAREAVR